MWNIIFQPFHCKYTSNILYSSNWNKKNKKKSEDYKWSYDYLLESMFRFCSDDLSVWLVVYIQDTRIFKFLKFHIGADSESW